MKINKKYLKPPPSFLFRWILIDTKKKGSDTLGRNPAPNSSTQNKEIIEMNLGYRYQWNLFLNHGLKHTLWGGTLGIRLIFWFLLVAVDVFCSGFWGQCWKSGKLVGKLSPVFWWDYSKTRLRDSNQERPRSKPDFFILIYVYIYTYIFQMYLKTYFGCFNMQKLLEFLQRTLCIALAEKHLLHLDSVLFTCA